MYTRKVQRIGKETFFVSLPRKWALRFGIEKGDEVSIETGEDGSLVIRPSKLSKKRVEETVVNFSDFFERELLGKYLLGYNIIKIIKSKRFSYEEREEVEKAVKKLVGLEIVEETQNEIVVHSVLDASSTHPSKILQRMCVISSSMYKDVIEGIAKNDKDLIKLAVSRDDEVDRVYFYLVRVLRTVIRDYWLMSNFSIFPIEVMDYRIVASKLEQIGDFSVDMGMKAINLSLNESMMKKASQLNEVVNEINNLQNESLNLFLSKRGNVQEIKKKILEYESISNELNSFFNSKVNSSEEFFLHGLYQILATVRDIIDLSF